MSINALLNAAETLFNSQLNGVKNISKFAGPFTPQAIVAQSFTSPAIFFGSNGAQEPRPEDARFMAHYGSVMACRFTAIVVAKHAKSQVASNQAAMLGAQELAAVIHETDFGLDYVGAAYNRKLEPLAAGQDKTLGHLSFWRVTWWHAVALNGEQLLADWQTLDTFEGYDADHFLTDADTETDAPKMESQENY